MAGGGRRAPAEERLQAHLLCRSARGRAALIAYLALPGSRRAPAASHRPGPFSVQPAGDCKSTSGSHPNSLAGPPPPPFVFSGVVWTRLSRQRARERLAPPEPAGRGSPASAKRSLPRVGGGGGSGRAEEANYGKREAPPRVCERRSRCRQRLGLA